MISKKIESVINDQINKEFYSAHLYLQMGAWFDAQNWKGLAGWMKVQADEEFAHARKLYDYLITRGGTVVLAKVEAPPDSFKSVTDVFEKGLTHEKLVTKRIHILYELAEKDKDYATSSMLKWFIDEQVEEEANFEWVVESCHKIGEQARGIFALDHQLGKRKKG